LLGAIDGEKQVKLMLSSDEALVFLNGLRQ
jgi:hypothetical protein